MLERLQSLVSGPTLPRTSDEVDSLVFISLLLAATTLGCSGGSNRRLVLLLPPLLLVWTVCIVSPWGNLLQIPAGKVCSTKSVYVLVRPDSTKTSLSLWLSLSLPLSLFLRGYTPLSSAREGQPIQRLGVPESEKQQQLSNLCVFVDR